MIDGMGRRRGKSTKGGEAALLIVGAMIAAAVAIYQFVVENAAVIAAAAIACGGLYLLLRALFWATRREAPPRPPAREPTFKNDIRPSLARGSSSWQGSALARWVHANERVTFGKVEITGGFFYLGDCLAVPGGVTAQYAINPNLSARAQRADIDGSSMPYWPSYAEMDPAARRAFLEWMLGGRRDPAYGIGLIFIFFYGLEHRMFVERGDDAASLIGEVKRLLAIYGTNGSFHHYANHFLNIANVQLAAPIDLPALSAERAANSEMDLATRLYLGQRLLEAPVLSSADDALRWVLAMPDTHLRTPAVRCFDEFVTLWMKRFAQRYPSGLSIRTNKRISLQYRAASGAFTVDVHGPHEQYLDVSGLTKQLDALRTLVEDCTAELDGFSRFVGRKPNLRNSVVAAGLLPPDIWQQSGSAAIDDFRRQVETALGAQGRASTTAQMIFEMAGFEVATSGKIPTAAAEELGRALDVIGVALEPDPRYGSSVPRADEQVFIFRAANGGPVDPSRPAFRAARTQVEVAVLAAGSDGDACYEELQRTISRIRATPDLSGVEQARLIAFAVTTFNSPPKQARVFRKLQEVGEAERQAIADAAVAVVGGGASVDIGEVKFLERLHKSLGLPSEAVYQSLHRAAAERVDEPVSISEEARAAGIPIPKDPARPAEQIGGAGIKIDAAKLARTRRETEAVAGLLSDIFSEDVAEPPSPKPDATIAWEGLDRPYTELVQLLEQRGSMPRSEFDRHARDIGLLPDGAIERINDWSFDRFDDALIEDGDDVVLAPHLRGRLLEMKDKAA
ncbi:TerB N-terminal domain-containing protein [Bradyrhizobium sp.]|uniref:tellurite resistance TerB family protein n=1 Tax=Bradyrhizobium sp. TaxID=376 RepID=UPI00262B5997|nr:TerB N-terminal domain-containing protein [Bradyrhizobium sp.]